MPITVEQYAWDQLSKNRHAITLDNILRHFKSHPQQGNSASQTKSNHSMQANKVLIAGAEP